MLTSDLTYLQRAIELAARGLFTTHPNPRVGCVLVKDNKIIAEGWHQYAGGAHAEIHALQQAGAAAKGATCYVNLEPCCHHGRTAPCTDALIKAGISRVVAAMEDPNPRVAGQGFAQLRAAGIQVDVGLLSKEAHDLKRGFIKRMQTGMPFVTAKSGMSLDGKIALANGVSQWISCPESLADSHLSRACSSAILTGIGTILADDPRLTARLPDATYYPLRVIADTHLRTPPGARCLHEPGKTLIVTTSTDKIKQAALQKAGAEIILLPSHNQHLDLTALLSELAKRECNEVHVEAGSILTGALLTANLVDELVCYIAPKLLGNTAQSAVKLPQFTSLDEVIKLQRTQMEIMGEDVKLVFRKKLCSLELSKP